jgi:hypothetical protein
VFDADTTEIGHTDVNGYFELTIHEESSKLIFGFIAYDFLTVTFNDSCLYFEVILLPSGTYDIRSHKKIDRLRKREYDKVIEVHRRAYNEVKFIYKETCYTSEFVPEKPALDIIRKKLKQSGKADKNDFKELKIGDIVKIPFGIDTSENENRVRTYFAPCRNCTEEDFDYLVEGEILKKHKRKLTLEIRITKMLPYDVLNYRCKTLNVGSSFKYEMKYNEVIIEK